MSRIDELTNVIWNYHHMHQPIEKADVLLVLGSNDLRVAEYAAKLFTDGYAPLVVISGGIAHANDLLKTSWNGSEAEKFAEVMMANGVPREMVLLETKAQNTGENFALSKNLLDDRGMNFDSVLVVTKPYMERRAFATGAKQWPDKKLIVTSPPLSFAEYISDDLPKNDVINIMMGDLQRIDVYGKSGFQVPQEIPDAVWAAFNELKALGYTRHLLIEK